MLKWILSPLAPLGRILLCAIFLLSAVANKIPEFTATADKMEKAGIPLPQVALVGAIVFLIVGSVSVIVGWKARIGALLLLVFLILATYYFHDFWNYQEQEAMMAQMQHFMKNVALAGAMLLIMSAGGGPWTLDNYIEQRLAKARAK